MAEADSYTVLPPLGDPPPAIHVVGAGGAGMSAIATVLFQMGYIVSGSDQTSSDTLNQLASVGVHTLVGHNEAHVTGAAIVTASTAVPRSNPELVGATANGIPVWSRADMLGALTRVQPTVAIAGTHGKTTTSAMLAAALSDANMAPSFIIGAEVRNLGCSARWEPAADWFIVEADESDGTFLELDHSAAIVTSVELDHLTHYGSEAALIAAFDRFVVETDGPIAVCIDDSGVRDLIGRIAASESRQVVTYGTSSEAEVWISDHVGSRRSSHQSLLWDGQSYELNLSVPGLHNVRNAAGAFAVATAIGADPTLVAGGLGAYDGVARRFEFRGAHSDITFVDDYAHLPTEIEAAIDAAVDGSWSRVVVVFQPHRFTRTAELHREFGPAFAAADLVIVTDIYSSGEAPIDGISGELVAHSIGEEIGETKVAYVPALADLPEFLTRQLVPGDLCLTLGAGDLTTVPDVVIDELRGLSR